MIKQILIITIIMVSSKTYSNPVEGSWKGPCVIHKNSEGKFEFSFKSSYIFSDLDDQKSGTLNQTEDLYTDELCSEGHTVEKTTLTYSLGSPSSEGIYPLNVNLKIDEDTTVTFYDIAKQVKNDENSVQLFLGKDYSTEEENRPKVLSEVDRVYSEIN